VYDDYLRVAEAHPQSVAEVEDVSARVLRLQEAEEGCLLCLRGIERDQVVMDSRVLVVMDPTDVLVVDGIQVHKVEAVSQSKSGNVWM
jgi:hypothetical protein